MKILHKKLAGFTILELIVVVAVIGFLSSISIVALSISQSNVRDRQRQLDQLSIIKAAELYSNDFGGIAPSQLGPVSFGSSPLAHESRLTVADVLAGFFGYPQPAQAALCTNQCGPGCEPHPVTCQCTCEPQGGPPVCGNQICESGEQGSCPQDCTCSQNGVCEPAGGENVTTCPADCYSGYGGSGGPDCGNLTCDAGETPGNCSNDCTNSSMCFANGEWDLCCLFADAHCTSSGLSEGLSGYYGVCDVDRCVQRYLLQPPSHTCSADNQCAPISVGVGRFVSDTDTNWLDDIERYLLNPGSKPIDPGHKPGKFPNPAGASLEEDSLRINKYWCSSHPDVVKQHKFCCWAAMEDAKKNINPYTDITKTPTGDLDDRWSILCLEG